MQEPLVDLVVGPYSVITCCALSLDEPRELTGDCVYVREVLSML